jgi:hypothetical protein
MHQELQLSLSFLLQAKDLMLQARSYLAMYFWVFSRLSLSLPLYWDHFIKAILMMVACYLASCIYL